MSINTLKKKLDIGKNNAVGLFLQNQTHYKNHQASKRMVMQKHYKSCSICKNVVIVNVFTETQPSEKHVHHAVL